MLHELEISRFRCFEQFVARDLTRLNLIVGKNNAGKTCFLEALAVLAEGGPAPLASALRARGELVKVELVDANMKAFAPEARHAFFGHRIESGATFSLAARSERTAEDREVHVSHVELATPHVGGDLSLEPLSSPGRRSPTPLLPPVDALRWVVRVGEEQEELHVPLGPEGRMEIGRVRRTLAPLPVRLLRTQLGDRDDIAELWEPIAGTEHEDSVVDLLHVVEPDIEKIVATPGAGGAIFVRLKGTRERIPFGSFGDGTTRLFALACNMVAVQHGLLLVDEIDTGLHVDTMVALWRFLARAAERLDVQVFATTHSDDCIRGLADFLREEEPAVAWTKLYRIERGAKTMMVYSGERIIRTAEANIEVR